jgi:hypothetical protein
MCYTHIFERQARDDASKKLSNNKVSIFAGNVMKILIELQK